MPGFAAFTSALLQRLSALQQTQSALSRCLLLYNHHTCFILNLSQARLPKAVVWLRVYSVLPYNKQQY